MYIECVTLAIRQLRDFYVKWPEGAQRECIKRSFGHKGFPGVIGVGDGCLMKLTEAPSEDTIAYYTCKKCWGVSL